MSNKIGMGLPYMVKSIKLKVSKSFKVTLSQMYCHIWILHTRFPMFLTVIYGRTLLVCKIAFSIQNLSDIDFDISRSLNDKCDDTVAPI